MGAKRIDRILAERGESGSAAYEVVFADGVSLRGLRAADLGHYQALKTKAALMGLDVFVGDLEQLSTGPAERQRKWLALVAWARRRGSGGAVLEGLALEERVAALEQRVAELEQRVAELEETAADADPSPPEAQARDHAAAPGHNGLALRQAGLP